MSKIRENIISNIHDATSAHKAWLDQAKKLLAGESIHSIQEPTPCTDCDFGLWFYSQGKSLEIFPWFKEVDALHDEFHVAYKLLYDEKQRIYNPTSMDKLNDYYSELEKKSNQLVNKLDKIKHALGELPDVFFDKGFESYAQKVHKTNEADASLSIDLSASFESKKSDLSLKLKKEELKQVELEKKLIEQDIKQIEERSLLISEGVEQVTHYRILKEEELEDALQAYNLLEVDRNKIKQNFQQSISKLDKALEIKRDEAEQLALLNNKLERRKVEEKQQQEKVESNFVQQISIQKQDLSQLDSQRQEWQQEVTSLKQQVDLIEQDIASLDDKYKEKQTFIDKAKKDKELKLNELQEQSLKQVDLDANRLLKIKITQSDLEKLEQQKAEEVEALIQIDLELSVLKKRKHNTHESHEEEIKELGGRERLKESRLLNLEKENQIKKEELLILNKQQDKIQQDLELMNNEMNIEKDLEPA